MAAPTYIQEAETPTWDTTDPKTTATHAVQTNDILVLLGAAELESEAPTMTPSGVTLTLQQDVNLANSCRVRAWTGTAGSNGNASQTFDGSGNYNFGGNALTFRGSSGIGNTVKSSAKGAGTVSITTTQADSAIAVIVADWSAGVAGSWNTTVGTPTEVTSHRNAAAYTVQIAYYPNAGATGSKTVGITGGADRVAVAVEITGTGGAAPTSHPPIPGAIQRLIMGGF